MANPNERKSGQGADEGRDQRKDKSSQMNDPQAERGGRQQDQQSDRDRKQQGGDDKSRDKQR